MTKTNSVALRIAPETKSLGEFTVKRLLPDARRQRVGPFIFFDHMGPTEFSPGSGVNVRAHPHIGLATITFLFEGEIVHRDSLGYAQPIRPGDVNWMTAGKGIVHSEKASEEILASGQRLHGLQTWVALPLELEETDARFEHYAREEIPSLRVDGAEVTVIAGSAFGVTSPVRTASETLYVDLRLDAAATVPLPQCDELGVYVVDGDVAIDGQSLGAQELAVLEDRATATLKASSAAHVVLCGGGTLEGDRIIWWNFVSSSRERLERAKKDWNEGRFDAVPGESEFIPLPKI